MVAANFCGVLVGPVVILATEVDVSGETETVCSNRAGRGAVTISAELAHRPARASGHVRGQTDLSSHVKPLAAVDVSAVSADRSP
jgi:hypothetical protein